ncbi:iron-containing alcohol dehydrogenase [Alphaproteobacteria bacterium]|nr:iron-containing alcohol dehydrogenase [Alphaproteobacteria bacterium]
MKNFVFNTTPCIEFGMGSLQKIGEIIFSKKIQSVLIVTDPGIISTNIITETTNILDSFGIKSSVFSEVKADPPEKVIFDCTNQSIKNKAEMIVGIGGGSSLDVAKLVSVLSIEKEKLNNLYGIGNVDGPRLPLILIPTTAGTGSEVTAVSIVTTGISEKKGVVSPIIIPDIAILDPSLTIGLPPHITAATGIDAMVHAIEAYSSINENNNLISKSLAVKALNLMGVSIEKAVKNGSNIEARSNMLLGSMFAGQAFANSPVAGVHALAYPLGGHYKVPHGLSNSLVLPHVLRFNAVTCSNVYAEIAPHIFPEIAMSSSQEMTQLLINNLEKLSERCGLEQKLRQVGVEKESLPFLAKEAMKQTRLLVNNPRKINVEDALNIYEAAW